MSHTPPTQGLYEFVTVVEAGSVSAAARALELPRATLSRRISALEHDCGVRLLHRTTRKLTLTEAGDALYKRARRIIDDAREAWTTVRRLDDTPRGLLRISIPPMLGQDLLAPSLIKYARLYPEVRLEVMATTRHVDLIADRVDVALRAGTVHDPTLIVRRLWQMRASLVASPAYLARYGTPRDAEALTHHH